MMRRAQEGFTLVEMIMVIVITGIIGGIVAVFLKAPVQQYMDVARRADMTDIADTALRRVTRDLHLALPNSVRVTGPCGGGDACFLEFLPAPSGGRYRADAPGDELDFTVADTSFEVLGVMPTVAAGDFIVVYNMTSDPADPNPNAYTGGNRTPYTGTAGSILSFAPKLFPFDSPGHRFHVVTAPVSYVCDGAGTLWRYWGYAIQAGQPNNVAVVPLSTANSARLATNVSNCRFTYDPLVVGRSGLVTMQLAITEQSETATLYNAAHVSNQP